jgi:hypothetical protein
MGGGRDALHARIAPRFARTEPRRRGRAYLRACSATVGRKNGGQLAEHARGGPPMDAAAVGHRHLGPDRVRDDCAPRSWSTWATRSGGGVDETGFCNKGPPRGACTARTRAPPARSTTASWGRARPCQPNRAAFLDRERSRPRSWTEDPARCRAARGPAQVGFQTKPQLARSCSSAP